MFAAMVRDPGKPGFRLGAFRQMPDQMAEMGEPCLRQGFVNREHRTAGFRLQFETMHVDLRAGQKLEPHGADQDEIGPRPTPFRRTHRGGVLHDANAIGWEVEPAPKCTFEVAAQRLHEPGLRPGFGGFRGGGLRAVERGQKNLAALAT
jgi:hypothetical protein